MANDSAADSSTGSDTSTAADADAGHSPCASGAQPTHLPAGFTQVFASAVDPEFATGVSMALDENDDPMFAYLAVPDSVQHGTAPGSCNPGTGSLIGCDAVYFTRWDQCAGAFTTPVVVEPVLNYYGGNPGQQFISLAYDKGTHEVGIAYLKLLPTDVNWADAYSTVNLATLKAGESTFAIQQVSDNLRWGVTDVSTSDTPTLAMGGGNLYLTFTAAFGAPGCAYNPCLRFASSTTSPPDGGADDAGDDAGAMEAGPSPPHYFDLMYVPYTGGQMGVLQPRSNALGIAIDSMGNAGVAAYQTPITGYDTVLAYWRPGWASAVTVTDSNDVQNDFVSLGLAFEGTSPRVAGMLSRDLTSPTAYGTTYVSSSDDGTTWNAAQPFVLSAGLAFYTSLATDGKGHEAFTSHYNTSVSPAAQDAGCGSDPFVSRSSNSGAAWSGCTLSAPDVATNTTLSTTFGTSRLAGKYVLGSAVNSNGATTLDGGPGYGIVYYQDP